MSKSRRKASRASALPSKAADESAASPARTRRRTSQRAHQPEETDQITIVPVRDVASPPAAFRQHQQEPDRMSQMNSNEPATVDPVADQEKRTAGSPQQKRFDIFVVDVGWNSPIAEALRNNLSLCLRYQANATVYILTQDQCMQLFRSHPPMIGTEPSVIIIDREACKAKRPQGFGFKLNLGLIRDYPTANNLIKWVLSVLAEQRPGSDITEPVRTVIHKEGLRGAIEIMADIARSPVGETMTH